MYHGDDDGRSARLPNERQLAADLVGRLRRDKRMDRVERIRQAIAADEYENRLKLHVGLDRLLGRLSADANPQPLRFQQ